MNEIGGAEKPAIYSSDEHLAASVIVPAHNAAGTLGACLDALQNQTLGADRFEVIVVDDGSTDHTAEVAAKHGVVALHQDHAGAASARNLGAKQAHAEILLFTDADCEPMPDWIEEMLAPFADPTVAGVKGVYHTHQRSPVALFAQAEYEEKYARLARDRQIDFVDTYAAAYRRDVFWDHGGFDATIQMVEDQEFSFRLASAGRKLVFTPQAAVYHLHQAILWGYIRRKIRIGYWKVRIHTRYPDKAIRDSYTPWTQKAQMLLLPVAAASVVAAATGVVPWLSVAVALLLGLASALPLIARSARHGRRVLLLSPLLVLLRALALAAGIALGVADRLAAVLRALPSVVARHRSRWLPLVVAGATLAVYVATLAPGLTFEHNGADGGDLITAARVLGVPHPSGYPTYTLLAWLFTHLPIGVIAYRVNLLSAVCAAAAVGLVCQTTQLLLRDEPHRDALAAAAALSLGFSALLWSQAVIAEVYALLALFASLFLWLLVRWRAGGPDRLLWLAGLVMGLGLGNHLTLVFAAPAGLVLLWSERRRLLKPRIWLPAAGFLVAGLSVYSYLPLAAARDPAVNWGDPRTWKRFLWVVTGEQYQSFAFGLPVQAMPSRLSSWAALLGDQFGWWGLILVLAGAWAWWRRDRRFFLSCLAWILPLGIYSFFYDTGDAYVYLVPAVLLLALWWGKGAGYVLRLGRRLRPAWRCLLLVVILLLPFTSLAMHWRAADLSDDWTAHAYIYQALDGVPTGALVVVRGDRPTFSLWYALYAERQRPDLAVVSGPLLAYVWYREEMQRRYPQLTIPQPMEPDTTIDDMVRELIIQNAVDMPVYATDPSDPWRAWFDFIQEGHPIYRVQMKHD
jgi:4-amino-4-deoxy-L-arabinose transferase-like glycosyltransferase